MAKAYYVKNETPAELVSPILEALRVLLEFHFLRNML
jgi:hypothetical protein